jgi:hypothetical protein
MMSTLDDDMPVVGRTPSSWRRIEPGWLMELRGAWNRFREDHAFGRRLRGAALADPRDEYLILYLDFHLYRLTADQKDRLIAAWREVLGIRPLRSPPVPPVGDDEGPRFRPGDRVRPTDGAHSGVLMEFVAAVDHGPGYPPMARCRVVLHDGSLADWEANVYLDHLERAP